MGLKAVMLMPYETYTANCECVTSKARYFLYNRPSPILIVTSSNLLKMTQIFKNKPIWC